MARRISSDDRKALLADVREEIVDSKQDTGESGEATSGVPVMDSLPTEMTRQFRFSAPGANSEE